MHNYVERWGEKGMKVFISWSGEKSCEVAKILKQWIPCIIQSVEPYFSSADIDKGARWSTDIAKELEVASFGILCVTKDNLNSSWLNFEAGALSKSIDKSRVCPFLVDMKPSDIKDSPILQFQMTSMIREDVYQLFVSINKCLNDNKLKEDFLKTTFETFWPKLEDAFSKISDTQETDTENEEIGNSSGIAIEEILELVRYQHKILKNPEELLPMDYLTEILDRLSYNNRPSAGMRDLEGTIRQIRNLAKECNLLSSGMANELNDEKNHNSNSCECNKIWELSEKALRILLRNSPDNIKITSYKILPDDLFKN